MSGSTAGHTFAYPVSVKPAGANTPSKPSVVPQPMVDKVGATPLGDFLLVGHHYGDGNEKPLQECKEKAAA